MRLHLVLLAVLAANLLGSTSTLAAPQSVTTCPQTPSEDVVQGYDLWNEIVYGDNFGDNDVLAIGDEAIRGWQLRLLSEEERKELADRWLAQYEGVPELVAEYRAALEACGLATVPAGETDSNLSSETRQPDPVADARCQDWAAELLALEFNYARATPDDLEAISYVLSL